MADFDLCDSCGFLFIYTKLAEVMRKKSKGEYVKLCASCRGLNRYRYEAKPQSKKVLDD